MKQSKTRHTAEPVEWSPLEERRWNEEQGRADKQFWTDMEESEEQWKFVYRVFRLSRPRPVPRRLKRHHVWKILVTLGMTGALSHLLNGGPHPGMTKYVLAIARALKAKNIAGVLPEKEILSRLKPDSRLLPGLGALLIWFFEQEGWLRVQLLLLKLQPPSISKDAELRELWMEALKESILFERCGFLVAQCAHGQHYYVSDDSRRRDCPDHRLAGQQARWRDKHPKWKLSVKSRARKKASAQGKPRSRSRV